MPPKADLLPKQGPSITRIRNFCEDETNNPRDKKDTPQQADYMRFIRNWIVRKKVLKAFSLHCLMIFTGQYRGRKLPKSELKGALKQCLRQMLEHYNLDYDKNEASLLVEEAYLEAIELSALLSASNVFKVLTAQMKQCREELGEFFDDCMSSFIRLEVDEEVFNFS